MLISKPQIMTSTESNLHCIPDHHKLRFTPHFLQIVRELEIAIVHDLSGPV